MILSLILACSGTSNDSQNATRQPFPLGYLHLCSDPKSVELSALRADAEVQLILASGVTDISDLCWMGNYYPRGLSSELSFRTILLQANLCDVSNDSDSCLY